MNFPSIQIPWKVEEAPPIFSEERKYRNWQQRKVEIIVSGIAGVVFAAVAIGCCFSPVALIASPIFGALSLACLSYSSANLLLRKPVPLPPPTWNKWIPVVIAAGSIVFPQFRIGALCGAAGFIIHTTLQKITDWMFSKFKQKMSVVTWEKSPPGSFDKYRDFYDFDQSIEIPIIEEVINRGLLQPAISWITGSENLGLIGSSVLFGAAHLLNRNTAYRRIHQVVGSGLSGLMYGWLNNRYGLIAPIAAHILHNSLGTLNKYLK